MNEHPAVSGTKSNVSIHHRADGPSERRFRIADVDAMEGRLVKVRERQSRKGGRRVGVRYESVDGVHAGDRQDRQVRFSRVGVFAQEPRRLRDPRRITPFVRGRKR
jgi:hypothetical protein